MSKNTLVEIPFKDWPRLCGLYINRILESNSISLFQNYINWLNCDPSLKELVKLYSLNGDWTDGTFVLKDHDIYTIVNTLEDSQERLLSALHCLDKKEATIFLGCPVRIKKTIERYFTDLGINKELVHFNIAIWYHLESNKCLEFNTEPPTGITLSQLQAEDADTINQLWPHNYPGSDLFIGRLIRFNTNIGAYDENGQLIAWCLVMPIGSLGMLQVRDSHKRKGFGSLVVRAMAKLNANKGIETFTAVVEENTASKTMFENLGFQELDKIFWVHKPSIE